MGGVWGRLGPPLGAFDRLLAVVWAFKIELLSSIGSKWAPEGLLDGFGIAAGGFWGGLGKVYKENLEDFGPFQHIVGRFRKCLT